MTAPQSAVGFGGTDWLIFLFAALLLVFAVVWTPRVQYAFCHLAERTPTCMLVLFALPIILRLLLLPHHPVPSPDIYDEFSHLLVADTLLHFRLANPPHALHQFFETFFVLQQPTYSSIYPLGQGIVLAFGRIVSGVPWTGVLILSGALSTLCYWMLRAWISPVWALTGGLLAVIQFGPLNSWTNSYWGGSLAASAGCLVFGALPRLAKSWRARDAAVLGLGFSIHMLSRQFESIFLLISVALFFVPVIRNRISRPGLLRCAAISGGIVLAAGFLILCQNRAVTHTWTTLPEQLSQYQYGVPTTLTIQLPAQPHVELTPQQTLDYRAQTLMHGPARDTLSKFLLRLEYRVRDYRFFFLPPLYIGVVAFLFTWRTPRFWWIVATLGVFALGTNLFPFLLVHYLAAVTGIFILVALRGLELLSRLRIRESAAGSEAVKLVLFLCGAHFVFWYGLHLFEGRNVPIDLLQFETWDSINHAGPVRRIAIQNDLARIPGKLLAIVHYTPQHVYQDEWVWNAADIDASRIVWVRDLGTDANQPILHYYPDRKPLLIEPDLNLPRVSEYPVREKP